MKKKCTCKVGEPYNNICCKIHGNLNRCTCERPDDNTCDYCEEQETQQILSDAKSRATELQSLEKVGKTFSSDEVKEIIYNVIGQCQPSFNDNIRKLISEELFNMYKNGFN